MTVSRRGFLGFGAAALLAACDNSLVGNGVNSNGAAKVDARVDATRDYLFTNYPGTQDLARNAKGILFMPLADRGRFRHRRRLWPRGAADQ